MSQVPSQESERSYIHVCVLSRTKPGKLEVMHTRMCVKDIDFVSVSTIFRLDLETFLHLNRTIKNTTQCTGLVQNRSHNYLLKSNLLSS